MASAPIIDSPCPFRVSAMPDAGRDHCGHCDRQVHNLDGMSSSQRKAFMASCEGKVCVAYTVHRSAQRRNLSLGVGLLASLAGSAAMAADNPAPAVPQTGAPSVDANTGVAASSGMIRKQPSDTIPPSPPYKTTSVNSKGEVITTTHSMEALGEYWVPTETTILTAEQIAAIPIPRAMGSSTAVFVGSVLDAKQARWVDDAGLDAHDNADLPEIGADDWLPTPKAP